MIFTTAFLLGGNDGETVWETEPAVVLKDQLESFSVFGSEPVGKAQWFTKLQKAAKVFSGVVGWGLNFFRHKKRGVG